MLNSAGLVTAVRDRLRRAGEHAAGSLTRITRALILAAPSSPGASVERLYDIIRL